MQAVRINQQGGPEVLQIEEVDIPEIGPKDVLIKVESAGVNFIDTYQRSGLYKIPLPTTLGLEAAGTIAATGSEITQFKQGDRVASTNVAGAYAQYAAVAEAKVVHLPESVSFDQGAATLLQGCTAHYLCYSTYAAKPGDICLVHAGAGGVGLLLTQLLKMLGATVITTVSTPAKAELSHLAGADHTILYVESDFEEEVMSITNGAGVHVAYDSVGKTTFEKSINCLRRFGMIVLYGNSSGPVTQFNPATLAPKGSLFLTRPSLFDYIADREDLVWRSRDLFNWLAQDQLSLRIEHRYPLQQSREAHVALEGRSTTGKIVLNP